jgi:hypothetical protein
VLNGERVSLDLMEDDDYSETRVWDSDRCSAIGAGCRLLTCKPKLRVLFLRVRTVMAAVTLFSCSCNSLGSRPVSPDVQKENRFRILKDAYESFNRGDMVAAVVAMDPNVQAELKRSTYHASGFLTT